MTVDTSKARAAILQRIRTNQRRSGASSDAERAAAEEYMARHPAGPRPVLSGDLKLHFRQMAERMASTVEEVPTLADAPSAVARYLASQGLPPTRGGVAATRRAGVGRRGGGGRSAASEARRISGRRHGGHHRVLLRAG